MPKPTPVGSRESTRPSNQEVATSLDQELDVGWYVQALWRRRKVILLITLLGAVAGYSVASLRPVLFEGVTTLLVVPPPTRSTAQVNLLPDERLMALRAPTFRAVLENASLAAKVIADTGLSLTPQRFLDDALEIEQPAGTSVLRVKVRLADPRLAADASRRLANAAITLTRRLNQEEGSSMQEQFKNHLQEAEQRRASAENELLRYQQSAFSGKDPGGPSDLSRRKIELARLERNVELTRKVHSDLLVRYEESRTQALGFSPQLQLVDEAIVPDLPMPRRRLQSSAIGFLTGLFGAGLAALMLEGRNRLSSPRP